MTEQEFIDYFSKFGTHIEHIYGDHIITKEVHSDHSISAPGWDLLDWKKSSSGEEFYMEFQIDNKVATIENCIDIIKKHQRKQKLDKLSGKIPDKKILYNDY